MAVSLGRIYNVLTSLPPPSYVRVLAESAKISADTSFRLVGYDGSNLLWEPGHIYVKNIQ